MAFNPEPVVPPLSARPDQVEKVLKTRYHDAKNKLQGAHDLYLLCLQHTMPISQPSEQGSIWSLKLLTVAP
uniref:Uncharacterized protein n=1 Tax=Lotus japonicus TaxID=34305 RepID=I3T866_LOTJA|nr:unknown [Lotus japonicus]